MKALLLLPLAAALAVPVPAQTVSAASSGKPALYVRHVKGPRGLTNEQLADDLNNTTKNIWGLSTYIRPFKEGVAAPEGEDLQWAEKILAQEVAALPALIDDGDVALSKGVPRGPKDDGPKKILSFLTMPVRKYVNPTPTQALMTLGAVRANVAGHLAALIRLKAENPPQASSEANTEQWLAEAKKMRAEFDK